MSLNPKAALFHSTSPITTPSISPTPMEKKAQSIPKQTPLDYVFPYTLQPLVLTEVIPLRQGSVSAFQKPSEVIRNTHFRPIRF